MIDLQKLTVVAEVAQAHDGSLGMAHAFIDAAARAGADAIKFQTHIAAAESTPHEPWRVRFSSQDETRYDYWKRMEFSEEQWTELRRHADEVELAFLSSAFSLDAVELLERVGVAAWKVASGEVRNHRMVDRMVATGLPVLLSTGMSSLAEVDAAVELLRDRGVSFAVLQCTSMYPTPAEKVGLNLLPFFRDRYGCPVGLSDHSGTVFPSLAAVALGANLLEVHLTLSRDAFGPDVSSSVTVDEFTTLVEGARFLARANAHPVDKDTMARELESVRRLFTKSVVVRVALPAGTVLEEQHLAAKKPGSGIPGERLSELVGRRLRRDVEPDHLLAEEDLA